MITVDVQDMQEKIALDEELVRRWAEAMLMELGRSEAELSIVFVDDRYIRRLNKQYLGRDRATNVISFPQQEGEGYYGAHLGDIVISVERAEDEAGQAGMTFDERLMQLLVHGICHLCGYDHEGVSAERAAQMEGVEQEILNRLGRG
jgi:probable rRNA maturation factor